MSDSPLRRFFAKAKDELVRPRGSVRKHKRDAGSTESFPPAVAKERVSSPFRNPDAASSLPISPPRTQVYHEEPQEIERTLPTLGSSGSVPVSSQFLGTHPTSSHQSPSTTSIPTPWESWTFDQAFLSQVYAWNASHPENTLDRILNTTSTLIERHDVLLELVPDGPIPFRGFVKALAHLVKLGTTIAEAKVVALKFAQDILQWVENLAAAFGDGEGGPFIAKAWANLAEIRKLIEEVCIWAHGMLKKSGLAERASAQNKILEFRVQFTQAIERFEVVSHIHIAMGQDRVDKHLDNITRAQDYLVVGQDHVNKHLNNITQAQDDLVISNTHLAIGQDHMNQHLATISRAIMQTRQSTLPDATYQVQKKIPCDPGTRKQVLDEIMNWIFDISEGSPCFFWLSGDPGVGKSAVTASIARECIHRNVLWAQYFINRNDAQTVDPQLYFPSIAKQMASCAPAVDHAVQNTLRDHPYLINDDISLDQATKLFVDTIRVAAASTPTLPVAVVIDALDETDHKRLKLTADIFSRVLVDLPHNAKVFISSRVETVIRDKFAVLPRTHNIHLSARNSIADVTAYLEMKVDEIMTEHHINWSRWGHERMRKLCSQASGLFIWAVTAIKYIQAQIEDFGTERLDMILNELNADGMQDINTLYMAIIQRIYPRDTPWQRQCFRRIVGAILVQQTPLSINDLKGLLDLCNPTSKSPVDIEHFVRRLRTIFVPGIDEITGRTIPRVHKSFSDFITSIKAQDFCVDLTDSNGELALQCINQLEHFWEGDIPGQLHYASLFWSSHLTKVVGDQVDMQEPGDDDTASTDDAHDVLSTKLEINPGTSVSIEPGPTGKGGSQLRSINISQDGTRIVYAHEVSIMLKDVYTGTLIEGSFKDKTNHVYSATFSPDGQYIASGSEDYTVQIWDAVTGEPAGQPLKGHTGIVWSTFFSPDSRKIVSASSDKTVCIWDVQTGNMLHLLQGHKNPVISALFSPDARYIVSSSNRQTVYVWDATTGQTVHILQGHGYCVQFAFFSPDGKNIISRGYDGAIIAWDLETGQTLPEYFTDSQSTNSRLSFTSSDTGYIITPPKSNTSSDEGATQSLSYFHVGEGGVAGGVGNAWVYANKEKGFKMVMYLGQLNMILDWT